MAKIIFSKTARFDLKEIIEYIKRDSVKYAFLEKEKIVTAIDKLLSQPLLGRIVPELDDENYRELFSETIELFIKSYLITIFISYPSITTPALSVTTPAFKADE